MRRVIGVVVVSLLGSPSAWARGAAERESAWNGSSITYRNEANVVGFDRGAELTHNPYYAMSLGLRGRYRIAGRWFAEGRVAVTRELTDSDLTTDEGEIWLSDLVLRGGGTDLYTIPRIRLSISADVELTAPTSPAAQARTLVTTVAPSLALRRDFAVLRGASFGGRVRATKLFHRATTAERDAPLISACGLSAEGCAAYLGTGVRNASVIMSYSLDGQIQFLRWFGLSAMVGWSSHYLHQLVSDPQVSFTSGSSDVRHYLSADLALQVRPWSLASFVLGASAAHLQRAPDDSFRVPLFNRYTMVYLDVVIDVVTAVSRVRQIL